MDEKKSMNSTKSSVVDAEKRDKEQFPNLFCRRVNFQKCQFQDVVESGNKILNPVEKDYITHIPVKEKYPDKGNEVGPDEGSQR
jgi:hypothetical protein